MIFHHSSKSPAGTTAPTFRLQQFIYDLNAESEVDLQLQMHMLIQSLCDKYGTNREIELHPIERIPSSEPQIQQTSLS